MVLKNYITSIPLDTSQLDSFGPTDIRVSQVTEFYKPLHASAFSLKVVLQGSERYRVNDRMYKVDAGEFLLVNKNSALEMDIQTKKPATGICLYPPSELLSEINLNLSTSETELLNSPKKKQTDFHFTEKVFKLNQTSAGKLIEAFKKPILTAHKYKSTLKVDDFFDQLCYELLISQSQIEKQLKGLSSSKKSTKEEIFRRTSIARDYLVEHFTEKVDLGFLAELCGMSKYHFCRSFQEIYRSTPIQFALQLRLQKAAELLKQDYSLRQVSEMVGYSDVRNLRRRLG